MVERLKFSTMQKIKVGDRVEVNLMLWTRDNSYVLKRLKANVRGFEVGVVKRIAQNGKIGIEFGKRLVKIDDEILGSDVYTLHGNAKLGYCLYVDEKYMVLQDPEEEDTPFGTPTFSSIADDLVACI
jgi:hypothetical protein